MPKKVTYGVTGLIDWNAIIPVGRACMRVHFSGGAITKYGITPAEYTTTDPLTQRIIEGSHYYRQGKITTLRSVGHNDVKPASRKCPVEVQQAFEQATLPLETEPAIVLDPGKSLQSIEVACIEDAVEYMRENYGVPSVRIRTVETLQKVAHQYNITFDIANLRNQ